MAFVCVICNDNLRCNSKDAILATFCGHLYHQSCLYRAIAVRRKSQHEQNSRISASTCPTCDRVIEKQKLMQIFPTEDESEEYQLERVRRERDELKIEISRLNKELTEFIQGTHQYDIERNPGGNILCSELRSCKRQIVELKATRKGLKRGSRVMWLKNEPEEGVIRWLGTIDGVVNAGIEFVNPVGNNDFPEINEEQLFSCQVNHGRMLPIQDIMLSSEFHGKWKSEFPSLELQINNNNERQKLEKIREDYQQLVANSESWVEQFLPKIGAFLTNEIIGDTVLINMQLQTAKECETDLATNKSQIFAVKEIAKILLESLSVPLYEKYEIDEKLEELEENFESLDSAIKSHMENKLIPALYNAEKCENLLSYRVKLLQDFKCRLRNMGKILIINEDQLAEQISELYTIQASFLAQKQEELSLSELFTTINEFRKYGSDSSKYERSTKDIISAHNQFLEEIDAKSSILNRTQLLYKQFIAYTSQFEEWYDGYLERLSKGSLTTDEKMAHLMQEKEEKRKELVQILNSAKELRVSIFDSTVLDDKIESLQNKWKVLLEKASEHRVRARKTF